MLFMDSVDKSAFYIIYVFSRNILAQPDAVYSTYRKFYIVFSQNMTISEFVADILILGYQGLALTISDHTHTVF